METVNSNLELANVIPTVFKRLLSGVHTATVARVDEYRIKPPRVKVTPLVNFAIGDQSLPYMPIDDVPVCFPTGSMGGLTFPVVRGDLGVLVYMERSIDEVMERGDISTPRDPRQFSLSDGIFIPGLFKNREVTNERDTESVELTCGEVRLVLNGGKVAVGVAGFELLDLLCQLVQTILTILPIVGGVPGTLDPTSITNLIALKLKFETIKGTL
jgi:hypothetical protein